MERLQSQLKGVIQSRKSRYIAHINTNIGLNHPMYPSPPLWKRLFRPLFLSWSCAPRVISSHLFISLRVPFLLLVPELTPLTTPGFCPAFSPLYIMSDYTTCVKCVVRYRVVCARVTRPQVHPSSNGLLGRDFAEWCAPLPQ